MHIPQSFFRMGLVLKKFGPFKVRKWIINYSAPHREITAVLQTLEDDAKMHHSCYQSKSDLQSLTHHLRYHIWQLDTAWFITPHAVASTPDGINFFLSLCLSVSLPHLYLSGGDEEKDFDIQRNTGTILIARRLNAARRSNYNMTVQVTDGHHNATTQVSKMNRKTKDFHKNMPHICKK